MAFAAIHDATIPTRDGNTYTVTIEDESGDALASLDTNGPPRKRLDDDPLIIRRDPLFDKGEHPFGVHSVSAQLRLRGETTLMQALRAASATEYRLVVNDGASDIHTFWIAPSKCRREYTTDPLALSVIQAECGILSLQGQLWTDESTTRIPLIELITDLLGTIALPLDYKTSTNWFPKDVTYATATTDPFKRIRVSPFGLRKRIIEEWNGGAQDQPIYQLDVLKLIALEYQCHIYQGSSNAWRIEQRHEKRQPDSTQQYFWNYNAATPTTEASKGAESAYKTYDEQTGTFFQADSSAIETGITAANKVYVNYKHGYDPADLVPSSDFTQWDDSSTPTGWSDVGSPTVTGGNASVPLFMSDGGRRAALISNTPVTTPASVVNGIKCTTYDFTPAAGDTVKFHFSALSSWGSSIVTAINRWYPMQAQVRAVLPGADEYLTQAGTWTTTETNITVHAILDNWGKFVQSDVVIPSTGHAADIQNLIITLYEAVDSFDTVSSPLVGVYWAAPRILHSVSGSQPNAATTTKSSVTGDPESRSLEVDLLLGDGPLASTSLSRFTWIPPVGSEVDTADWQEDDGTGASGVTFRRMWGSRRLEMSRIALVGYKRILRPNLTSGELPQVHDALKVGSEWYDSFDYVWHIGNESYVEAEWLENRKDSLTIGYEDIEREWYGEFPNGLPGPTPVLADAFVTLGELAGDLNFDPVVTWMNWQNAESVKWEVNTTDVEPTWSGVSDTDDLDTGHQSGTFTLADTAQGNTYYLFLRPFNAAGGTGDEGPTFRLVFKTPTVPLDPPTSCMIPWDKEAVFTFSGSGTTVYNAVRNVAATPDGTLTPDATDFTRSATAGLSKDATGDSADFASLPVDLLGTTPLTTLLVFSVARRDTLAASTFWEVVAGSSTYSGGFTAAGKVRFSVTSSTETVNLDSEFIVPLGGFVVTAQYVGMLSKNLYNYTYTTEGGSNRVTSSITGTLDGGATAIKYFSDGQSTLRFGHWLGDKNTLSNTEWLAEAICLASWSEAQGAGGTDGFGFGPDTVLIVDDTNLTGWDFEGNERFQFAHSLTPGTHGCAPVYIPTLDLFAMESGGQYIYLINSSGVSAKIYDTASATKLVQCLGWDSQGQRLYASFANAAGSAEYDYGWFSQADLSEAALLVGNRAWWLLDEASGNRSDSGPNAVTLTDTNTVASETQSSITGARFTQADSDQLVTTDATTIAMVDDWTFSCRLWNTGDYATSEVITRDLTANVIIEWLGGTGSVRVYFYHGAAGSSDALVVAATMAATGTDGWDTLTVIRDQAVTNTGQIWLNGVKLGSVALSGSQDVTAATFALGDGASDLLMAEAVLSFRVWSGSEIETFHNGAAALGYPALTFNSVLSSYALMDFELSSDGEGAFMRTTAVNSGTKDNPEIISLTDTATAIALNRADQMVVWQDSAADIFGRTATAGGSWFGPQKTIVDGTNFTYLQGKSIACTESGQYLFALAQLVAGDHIYRFDGFDADQDDASATFLDLGAVGDTVRGVSLYGSGASAPSAPSVLAAEPSATDGDTKVDLTWTDNADDELGFVIQRSATGSTGPFTDVHTLAADDVAEQDTGLTAETQYWWRIRSYNSAGSSEWSNVATTTTDAAPAEDLTSNLLAYWAFDETSGTRVDSHTGSYDLTDVNTVGYEAGLISNAASYLYTNSEKLKHDGFPDPTDDYTLCVWSKDHQAIPGTNDMMIAIVDDDPGDGGAGSLAYIIYRRTGVDRYQIGWRDSGGTVRSGVHNGPLDGVSDGGWVCLFLTHDSSDNKLRFYGYTNNDSYATRIDSGLAVAATGVFTPTSTSGPDIHFGGHRDGVPGFYSTGEQDSTAIYNRVLTEDEMDAFVNSGSGVAYADL